MHSIVAALSVWRYLPASSSAALSSTVALDDQSISLQATFASFAGVDRHLGLFWRRRGGSVPSICSWLWGAVIVDQVPGR